MERHPETRPDRPDFNRTFESDFEEPFSIAPASIPPAGLRQRIPTPPPAPALPDRGRVRAKKAGVMMARGLFVVGIGALIAGMLLAL